MKPSNLAWLSLIAVSLVVTTIVHIRILNVLPGHDANSLRNNNSNDELVNGNTIGTASQNILIVMAVDCKYDINIIANSLSYNPFKTHIYWYFNIHNKNTPPCENKTYPLNSNNIQLIFEPIYKLKFWADFIVPNTILKLFHNINLDYIWFVDDDMLLSEFHLEEFIKISFILNASISQPSFRSIDNESQPSSFDVVNDATNKYKNIIAKQTNLIEISAPFFTFNTWKIIHPYIVNVFSNISMCNRTNYGPPSWWCGAAKYFTNGSCVVIHYTPLIHANTRSMNKMGKFEKRGMKCKYWQQDIYSEWFANHTERNKTLKLFYGDSILPNNVNANIIRQTNKLELNFNQLKQNYPSRIMTINWLEQIFSDYCKQYIARFRSNTVTIEQLLNLNHDRLERKFNIVSTTKRTNILYAIKSLLPEEQFIKKQAHSAKVVTVANGHNVLIVDKTTKNN